MGDFSKEIQSTFPDEWVKAFLNINYTAGWLRNISEKQFAEYGISPQQYNVLRILKGAQSAINVNTVRERMIEKTPNITRLMDKLSEKKLIKRSRSQTDRRAVFVKITSEGLALIQKIVLNDDRLDLKLSLTENEAKELNRLLDKLR